MTIERERMLTPEQVAEWLQVSRDSVYRWIHQGKLPAIRVGRLFRVPEGEVLALLSTGRAAAAGGDQAATLREWRLALIAVASEDLPGNLVPILGELREQGDDRCYTLADFRAEAEARAATAEGLAAIEAAAALLDEEADDS